MDHAGLACAGCLYLCFLYHAGCGGLETVERVYSFADRFSILFWNIKEELIGVNTDKDDKTEEERLFDDFGAIKYQSSADILSSGDLCRPIAEA
jgi:hypothetical protein